MVDLSGLLATLNSNEVWVDSSPRQEAEGGEDRVCIRRMQGDRYRSTVRGTSNGTVL